MSSFADHTNQVEDITESSQPPKPQNSCGCCPDDESIPFPTGITMPVIGRILCCLCGVSITPNEAAMCLPCLQKQSDISSLLYANNHDMIQCRKCEKWQVGNDQWVYHALESPSLLTACMKKIPVLYSHDIKILDAQWIWTEPHSKRLQFSVEIQRPVLDHKILVQSKVQFEYVIKHKQCLDCIHQASDHTWGACIQLRQMANLTTSGGNSSSGNDKANTNKKHHKKIFYHIETLLMQQGLHNLMTNISTGRDGYDFYFKNKNQAEKVVNFIASSFPVQIKHSKKLISRDLQSNTTRYEYTMYLEIVPVNKYDLLLTPKKWSGKSEFVVVNKITSSVHVMNPMTLQTMELNVAKFVVEPSVTIMLTEKHLVPFIVLDIIPIRQPTTANMAMASVSGKSSSKKAKKGNKDENMSIDGSVMTITDDKNVCVLAEAVIAKESDLGENDITYTVTSHLGHILQAGDTVLGYDLSHSVFGARQEAEIDKLRALSDAAVPDVILVQKVYPEKDRKTRKKKRRPAPWMTKALGIDGQSVGDGQSEVSGQDLVEEDEEMEAMRKLDGIAEEDNDDDEDFEDDDDEDDMFEDLGEEMGQWQEVADDENWKPPVEEDGEEGEGDGAEEDGDWEDVESEDEENEK